MQHNATIIKHLTDKNVKLLGDWTSVKNPEQFQHFQLKSKLL